MKQTRCAVFCDSVNYIVDSFANLDPVILPDKRNKRCRGRVNNQTINRQVSCQLFQFVIILLVCFLRSCFTARVIKLFQRIPCISLFATQQTGFWFVAQSRGYLPDEVGALIWFGCDDAATSYLTPIYVNTKSVPECLRVGNGDMLHYSATSQFWMCNRVANACYKMYDQLSSGWFMT